MSGKWSGGFEYNLTTQSEFEEMKQQNAALLQENYQLKQSLSELIKINNELTDSLEAFNSSALGQEAVIYKQQNENLKSIIQELKMKLEDDEPKSENYELIQALEKLIQSFNEMQVIYENQIQSLCKELQIQKQQGEDRINEFEQKYLRSLKQSESLISFLKRKEEILGIIQKKSFFPQDNHKKGNNLAASRKMNGKFDMDTVSERKKSKTDQFYYEQEIQQLRNRERQLQSELKEKNKVLSAHNDLLSKLKKKLVQKY